jgi:hypothetical protein
MAHRSATSEGTGKRYRPDHRDDRLQRFNGRAHSVRMPIVAARVGAQSNRRSLRIGHRPQNLDDSSRRHSSAMLSLPRRRSGTLRTFSSAENFR